MEQALADVSVDISDSVENLDQRVKRLEAEINQH